MRTEIYNIQGQLQELVEILRLAGIATYRRYLSPDFLTPVEQRPTNVAETGVLEAEEANEADRLTWTKLQSDLSAQPANSALRLFGEALVKVLKHRNRWD